MSTFSIQRSSLVLVLAGVLAIAWVREAVAEGFGPLPARNFQPLQLLVLGMPGDRATVLEKGALDIRVELADTSSIFKEDTARVSATMKFETVRSGVFLRYGLTKRLELGLEVPALHRYRGFLEGAITATERATSGLAPARKALKNEGYAFNVSRDGQTLFSAGEGQLGLGDITLLSKFQVLTQNRETPTVALRFALKVPSGDARRFFGSGHTDLGAGVAVEKTLTSNWIAYANVNGVLPTGTVSGLTLSPVLSGIAAVEYLWSPALSVVAQFDYYSSPFRDTGARMLDRGVTELTAGFSYRLRKDLLWQVYGVENVDFITGSAADLTLSTLVTYRFRN